MSDEKKGIKKFTNADLFVNISLLYHIFINLSTIFIFFTPGPASAETARAQTRGLNVKHMPKRMIFFRRGILRPGKKRVIDPQAVLQQRVFIGRTKLPPYAVHTRPQTGGTRKNQVFYIYLLGRRHPHPRASALKYGLKSPAGPRRKE